MARSISARSTVVVAVDPRRLQLQGDGEQPLLGTVVQVALDPATLLEVRGRQPGTGLGHLLHLAGELGPQRQVVHLRRRLDATASTTPGSVRAGSNSQPGGHRAASLDVHGVLAGLRVPAVGT